MNEKDLHASTDRKATSWGTTVEGDGLEAHPHQPIAGVLRRPSKRETMRT